MNPVFEVVLQGFDGSADETDHLIKWVRAPNSLYAHSEATKQWGRVVSISGVIGAVPDGAIDLVV